MDRKHTWNFSHGVIASLLALALGGAQAAPATPPGASVQLPAPRTQGTVSVEQALQQRRSVRAFAAAPLALGELSQLLWAAQGTTQPQGLRTAPSAGGLQPLEVYLVAGQVAGLAPGVYRYASAAQALRPTQAGDRRAALAAAALGQRWLREAPAVLVIAAVHERTARKYGARAPRYVAIEAGHAAQNVYLQATASGLATVLVGAFDDAGVAAALGLPADEQPLALMPVGRAR